MSQDIFINSITAWKLLVQGEALKNPLPQEIEAENEAQYNAWIEALMTTKIAANKAGHPCQFNKGGTSTRRACWIKSGPHTLKVVLSQKARAQAVTETSKVAYHTWDFNTQRGQIAEIIFAESSKGLDITRKEIESNFGYTSNVVTPRTYELLKLSLEAPFEFNGKLYTLTTTPARLSVCPGASPVKNEGLMWVEVTDNLPEGAQTSLF